jgi:hypothetical protein
VVKHGLHRLGPPPEASAPHTARARTPSASAGKT